MKKTGFQEKIRLLAFIEIIYFKFYKYLLFF